MNKFTCKKLKLDFFWLITLQTQEVQSEHKGNFFSHFEGDWALARIAQRGCGLSIIEDV